MWTSPLYFLYINFSNSTNMPVHSTAMVSAHDLFAVITMIIIIIIIGSTALGGPWHPQQ
jgi:hypothetical protein